MKHTYDGQSFDLNSYCNVVLAAEQQQAYGQQPVEAYGAATAGGAADSPITNVFNSVSTTFKSLQESAMGLIDNGLATVRDLISGGSSALSRVSKQSIFDKLPSLPALPFISSRSIDSRPVVYFDVTIDDVPSGRILMELFEETAPQTVQNFKVLATGNWRGGGRIHMLQYFY